MFASLRRAHSAVGTLASLSRHPLSPQDRSDNSTLRLIDGEGHGAPLGMFAEPLSLPALAQVLDVPTEQLGIQPPAKPLWLCSVRSDPRHPDLSDTQWATVARRLVAATGLAPEGDPDACRWLALRDQPRQVHVLATVVREDGRLHNSYRDAFRLQAECHRLAQELGHLPAPKIQEKPMPAPSIAISAEISGSVVAHGASDDLSAALLKRAGFQQIQDWHGRRHRLASTTPADESRAIATYAAQMLQAARYEVRLDPTLDASTEISPTNPLGPYKTGSELLRLTDQVWAAPDGQSLARPVEHLIHPQHGGLERVREALEAVSARLEELDEESFELRDRFETAAELLTAAQEELTDAATEVRNIAPSPASQTAALAVSPSVAEACVPPSLPAATAQSQSSLPTAHTPSPRGR